MNVLIFSNEVDAARQAAARIVDFVADEPDTVLGLAAGRTFERVYAEVVGQSEERGVSFSDVSTFLLDEYVGVSPQSPESFQHFARRHLLDPLGIAPARTEYPDALSDDLEHECARYERAIRERGGIHLQLLGIGVSGHIGFNEPPSHRRSRTRVVRLTQETLEQNRPLFRPGRELPASAITMGVATILESRHCLLVATGTEKAGAVASAIEGPEVASLPASALQSHPHCTFVLDHAAASQLAAPRQAKDQESETPKTLRREG